MRVRVERLTFDEIPAASYRRLIGDSFFVSRGFADLWRTKHGEPRAWTIEADGALAAVLPGVEFRHGPVARFASMPDGCYGGVFVEPAFEHERARCVRLLLRALREHYTIVNIFDFHRSIGDAPQFDVDACEARIVSLPGEAWIPEDRTLVLQARKAEREGVRCERFDVERHLPGVMHLAWLTARAHGVPVRYPPAFHRALAGLAARDPRVVWRYCAHEGRPVCSQIYFVERGVLQAWQSYFDRSCSHLKPNPAMRLAVCREYIGRGGRTLNLGATPVRAAGLAAYKRRWGGRLLRYPGYAWSPLVGARARLATLAAAWARRVAGPAAG